jgi:hypothetical protein
MPGNELKAFEVTKNSPQPSGIRAILSNQWPLAHHLVQLHFHSIMKAQK